MSSPATVVDATRVSDIAKAIYAAVSPIIADDASVKEAQEAFQDAATARTSGRVGILLALSSVAASGSWTEGEISLATAQATKLSNNLESQKAIATFAADCKVAMHPKVRASVHGIFDIVSQAWADEKAQDKKLPRPIAKAFKREYHAFKSALIVTRDQGPHFFQHTGHIVGWAQENDPDYDAKKVRAQLDTIAATIASMAGNFPVEHFTSIMGFIAEVSEDTLKASRRELLQAQEDVLQAVPVRTTTVVGDTATVQVDDNSGTVCVDPVEAFLAEMDEGMAA